MKTMETTEGVSLHPGENGLASQKNIETPPVPEKNRGRTKKDLPICGAGRESQKRPTLVVGWKPYGKLQMIRLNPDNMKKTSLLSCRGQIQLIRLGLGAACSIMVCLVLAAQATPVIWADWTSGQIGDPGSVAGTMTFGSVPVSVTYTGEVFNTTETNGQGTDYYTPLSTYTSATITNPPLGGMITFVVGGATVDTFTFSSPVSNPVMAIMSLGSPGVDVDLAFSAPFTILSTGTGWWGGGPLLTSTGNTLHGAESDGLIQFNGTFSSISWTVSPGDSYYSGLTVGAFDVVLPAPNIQIIPGTGGNAASVVLSWGNPALSLQSATNVAGLYTTLTGATSPYTNNTAIPQMFFRLQAN
jgi:hypothetical protein